LDDWMKEKERAKTEGGRPRWTKPKKPSRIPSLPKTWVKPRNKPTPLELPGGEESDENDEDSDGENSD